MAETTVTVPIGLNEGAAQQQPAAEKPAWARRSLHNVRMGQGIANSAAVEVEAAPPPPPAYSQPAQQQETYMENQFSSDNQQAQAPQQPRAPQPPDLMNYDPYNPDDVARFHQDNAAFYQQIVDARLQEALASNRRAQNEAELVEQYNRVAAKYGDDSNFKTVIDETFQACARDATAGKPVDIEARYLEVSGSTSRLPGQRTAHLPAKAKTIKGLGELIEFNHRTGRARPFGGRNWKG